MSVNLLENLLYHFSSILSFKVRCYKTRGKEEKVWLLIQFAPHLFVVIG